MKLISAVPISNSLSLNLTPSSTNVVGGLTPMSMTHPIDIKKDNDEILEVPQFAASQVELNHEANQLQKKWSSERYSTVRRPYTSYSIVSKRGALPRQYHSNLLANRLYKTLLSSQRTSSSINTFSVINPIQALHASKYLNCIVVSGPCVDLCGQHFSEPSPGTSDYSYESVATFVDQIFKFQEFNDRSQRELSGTAKMLQYHQPHHYQSDYLAPIVADMDSGHGGITTVMKLTRMLVERGAAGLLIDDQANGTRSSIFTQGKVLVPVSQVVNRLLAIRVQLDVLDCDQVVFISTSAKDATLITSDIDRRDHRFILGASRPMTRLTSILKAALDKGFSEQVLDNIEERWLKMAELKTYYQAVVDHIQLKGGVLKDYLLREWFRRSRDLSLDDMHSAASSMGISIYWNAEVARTNEGYYRYDGGIEAALARATNYLSYADVTILDTEIPSLEEAEYFAKSLKTLNPKVMLGYQLPGLVDWDNCNLSPLQVQNFHSYLASFGFIYHHLKMVGTHSQALVTEAFTKDYKTRGLIAYIQNVQRPERYYQLYSNYRHYWTGSEYVNRVVRLAVGKEVGFNYGELLDKIQLDKFNHKLYENANNKNTVANINLANEYLNYNGTGMYNNSFDTVPSVGPSLGGHHNFNAIASLGTTSNLNNIEPNVGSGQQLYYSNYLAPRL